MSRHSEAMLELCAGYVLGILDDAERRVLEQHLAEGCPECEAELKRLGEGATLLAASAPPVAPPASLGPRVLELVRREGHKASGDGARAPEAGTARGGAHVIPMPPRQRASLTTWAWAAAAAVLAVTSIVMWRQTVTLQDQVTAARTALKDSQQQLADQQQRLADERRWSALLDNGTARVVDMSLTPAGKGILRARAIYDPEARRAVIVFSNFTPPAGSDYQLWALRDGKPASLGLIHADATGRAIIRLPDTGDPASLGAFAVSLEKAGGSSSETAPEGPVVMVGKVGGL
jgi:anti-sigma-K factor RskA